MQRTITGRDQKNEMSPLNLNPEWKMAQIGSTGLLMSSVRVKFMVSKAAADAPECFGEVGNAGVVSLLLSVNGAAHLCKF